MDVNAHHQLVTKTMIPLVLCGNDKSIKKAVALDQGIVNFYAIRSINVDSSSRVGEQATFHFQISAIVEEYSMITVQITLEIQKLGHRCFRFVSVRVGVQSHAVVAVGNIVLEKVQAENMGVDAIIVHGAGSTNGKAQINPVTKNFSPGSHIPLVTFFLGNSKCRTRVIGFFRICSFIGGDRFGLASKIA